MTHLKRELQTLHEGWVLTTSSLTRFRKKWSQHLYYIKMTIFLWLALCWHKSCHSNEMASFAYFTCSRISPVTGAEGLFQSIENIVHGSLFPQSLTQFSWSEDKIYESAMLYFGMEFLWLKPGAKLDHPDVYKTKCLSNAIAPHSTFYFIIFKHFCEKIVGDSFSRLLVERRDSISMHWGAIVGVFVNILVYFNKWENSLETTQ